MLKGGLERPSASARHKALYKCQLSTVGGRQRWMGKPSANDEDKGKDQLQAVAVYFAAAHGDPRLATQPEAKASGPSFSKVTPNH
jgi:hypothetical protein